eukprot:3131012-Rhodomonas_salina.2
MSGTDLGVWCYASAMRCAVLTYRIVPDCINPDPVELGDVVRTRLSPYVVSYAMWDWEKLSPYAFHVRRAVLSQRMVLRVCYATCGTELAGSRSQPSSSTPGEAAMCGTGIAYGALRRAGLGHRMVLSA